ncbi:MAG TPA: hypothetical protein VLB29_06600 [Nocardioidaceae bacterium]|nr:hypothetical protein [Nocardioidaceae bacterium]
MTDAFTTALIAELGKKTGVCWLRYDESAGQSNHRARAAWHIWYDEALHVVAGGDEQPLPGIVNAGRVEVVMRSKESGGRLVTWVGSVSVVSPEDEAWDEVTTALVAGRLNLEDLATAKKQWAENSIVVRIDPTGELLEEPGSLDDDPHNAPPRETGATTRGALPRVLHRRKRRRPGLS